MRIKPRFCTFAPFWRRQPHYLVDPMKAFVSRFPVLTLAVIVLGIQFGFVSCSGFAYAKGCTDARCSLGAHDLSLPDILALDVRCTDHVLPRREGRYPESIRSISGLESSR